jgi:hypothetical protein
LIQIALFISVLNSVGCTRRFWREHADREVYQAVATGTVNPRFELPGYTVDIDPRSRLFDPFDPDRPPMPPDDPESHRFMIEVDGKRGFPRWGEDGEVPDVELSDYRSSLPYNEKGEIVVDLAGALALGRLHSRDYQFQIEQLYLSALDVTFERFRFDLQFFAGNHTAWAGMGPIAAGVPSGRSTLRTTTDVQAQKLTTTGGSLIVDAANSIVWEFANGQTNMHSSLLGFAFTQPLLQFAGRARVLERLTRTERGLLSNLRQFERYRQGFFLELTTGRGGGGGLIRAGGFFGGAGLEGFMGVGAGGFGQVGGFGGGGGAFAGGGGTGALALGGFLGFLQTQQNLRNQRARIAALRDTWAQLEAIYDAGRLENRFQVEQARQAYYTAQSQLLNAQAGYESNLDAYKIELGLPSDLPLVIRDPYLERFNLMDPELTRLQTVVGDLLASMRRAEGADPVDDAAVRSALHSIGGQVRRHAVRTRGDLRALETALPRRRKDLERFARLTELQPESLDLRAINVEALDQRAVALRADIVRVSDEISGSLRLLGAVRANKAALDVDGPARDEAIEVLTDLSGRLLELSLLQARARIDAVTLTQIELEPPAAFEAALENRADWMNVKASLVDTWRLIRFNANALRSNLSVNISGNLGTVGNNPVALRDSNGTLRAGVQFDAPLTRIAERNLYRQSLIDYQQQRRGVIQFRDNMLLGLRARLRQINLNQINIELRRLAVLVSIAQVDVTRLKLSQPPQPGAVGPGSVSPTAARDLLDALGGLQASQDDFLSVWLDQEAQRMSLDFDLGTMQLTELGTWKDPGPIVDNTVPVNPFRHAADYSPVPYGPPPPWTAPLSDLGLSSEEELPPEIPVPPAESDLDADPDSNPVRSMQPESD